MNLPNETTHQNTTPAPRTLLRRCLIWAGWLLLIILLFIGIAFGRFWYLLNQVVGANTNPFQPPEMAAAQYSKKNVVADLGGMPVTIPYYFADYVEYDGDPGFGKREGPKPQRTQESKLSSFGFDVRYPDMAGVSSAALWQEKRQRNIHTSMWLSVGITTGKIYPSDGFLDRWTHSTVEIPNTIAKDANYEKLAESEYGLTVYAPVGIDPKTNKPYREGDYGRDVFVHRNAAGLVDTHIKCSNRPHAAAPCTQVFSLEPLIKAQIDIHYRRGLLPEWQKMQTSVTELILSFKTPETTSPTATATAPQN